MPLVAASVARHHSSSHQANSSTSKRMLFGNLQKTLNFRQKFCPCTLASSKSLLATATSCISLNYPSPSKAASSTTTSTFRSFVHTSLTLSIHHHLQSLPSTATCLEISTRSNAFCNAKALLDPTSSASSTGKDTHNHLHRGTDLVISKPTQPTSPARLPCHHQPLLPLLLLLFLLLLLHLFLDLRHHSLSHLLILLLFLSPLHTTT